MASISNSIALVRASGFGQLPELIARQAGEPALQSVFQGEGLPLALREAPMTPLPLRSMASLFSRAASTVGDRTFGLSVGEQMGYRAYGLWIEYCLGASTLGDALERLTSTSWAHQSGGSLELVDEGAHKLLRYCAAAAGVNRMQHSDHVLPPMRGFVRLFLGATWGPDFVEVDYARDPDIQLVEAWLQCPAHCARPGVGIAIRTADLARRRGLNTPDDVRILTLRDVRADVILSTAPEPARALSAVVALRLLDGRSDIDGAALHVGLSVQGLQRRLREKGFTYREVLEQARQARAISLLRETRMSVLAIALALGYETHAAFTRAFIRWTGCAPIDFRNKPARG